MIFKLSSMHQGCMGLFFVIGNCDAISYYKKTLREDAQTAEMKLIAAQYRGRARVLLAKLFVLQYHGSERVLQAILFVL